MIPKRVKQFYVNVTDKMTEKDLDYANEILIKKSWNYSWSYLNQNKSIVLETKNRIYRN